MREHVHASFVGRAEGFKVLYHPGFHVPALVPLPYGLALSCGT